MPVINARDVSKSYGPKTVLDGISLSIDEGERIGLVGLNGCGKSTLARILAGLEEADGGTITRRRDSRIAYLSQTPGFIVDRTAREEVLAGLKAWRAAKDRFDELGVALSEEADGSRLKTLLASHAEAQGEVERLGGFDLDHRAETILGSSTAQRGGWTEELCSSHQGQWTSSTEFAATTSSAPSCTSSRWCGATA